MEIVSKERDDKVIQMQLKIQNQQLIIDSPASGNRRTICDADNEMLMLKKDHAAVLSEMQHKFEQQIRDLRIVKEENMKAMNGEPLTDEDMKEIEKITSIK